MKELSPNHPFSGAMLVLVSDFWLFTREYVSTFLQPPSWELSHIRRWFSELPVKGGRCDRSLEGTYHTQSLREKSALIQGILRQHRFGIPKIWVFFLGLSWLKQAQE